ncbi:hypothetical protein [Candidatus Bandiella numerosa]|uniref:hypothetical protein n=1 Tax=Candidatus Bandiella numerosa TaxID=2570586 RepID=UPI001F219985|nr:hypothetical protein [Candidatus Bandiella numerosa]
MLQPIKDISVALSNIVIKVYGALYDYDKDVEDKKGVKHKDKSEEEAKKRFWNRTKAFLWGALDLFFGPSTLKIITLFSIAMLAFSPFGPIAIAVSVSISVLCLGIGVVIDGKNLKDLRVQQKEAKALEKIMELHKEKLEVLDQSPELKKILGEVWQKREILDGEDKTLKIKNVLQHFPEALIPLIGNVMTGNIISISAGIFCMMVGGVSAINEQKSFSKQREEMYEVVQANKVLLKRGGLEVDYPQGGGLDFLKGMIINTENEIIAIKNIQNKIAQGEITLDNPEQVKLQFNQELESVKNIPRVELSKADDLKIHGLNYYIKKAFMGSFSYDRSREIFAPLVHHNADNHKKLEEFYYDRCMGEKFELERVTNKIVVNDEISAAKSKQSVERGQSHVERLGTDSGLGKISRY